MFCLSDFQLSSPLLYKMVSRLMRKEYGSVTLAAGKKILGPDLCVYMALWVTAGLCGNKVSFWLISMWSMSLLCHCLWWGLQPDQAIVVLLDDWLLTSYRHHRSCLRFCLIFPPKPQTISLPLTITGPPADPPARSSVMFQNAPTELCGIF